MVQIQRQIDEINNHKHIIMKVTKALAFTLIMAGGLVAGSAAFAQDSGTAPASDASTNAAPVKVHGNHAANLDRLAQVLNLTDDQKAQLQPILAAERQKMRDLREDTSLSKDDRKAKMKEIRDETAAQLQPILTPEQLAKWQNMTHGHHAAPQAAPAQSTNAPAGSAQ
jgi:protein CpxP